MGRWDDDEDHDDEDDWYPEGQDDPDELDLVTCPACGEEIYEEAEQCPECGHYMVRGSNSPLRTAPNWYVAIALLGIVAVIIAMLMS